MLHDFIAANNRVSIGGDEIVQHQIAGIVTGQSWPAAGAS